MHKSKLMALIKKLQPTQLRQFASFLNSPLHNKNKQICRLMDYIRAFAPDYTDKALEISQVLKVLGITEGKHLRYTMSQLLKLAEEFLIWDLLQKRQIEKKKILIEIYQKLELPVHYNSTLRQCYKILNQWPTHDDAYLQQVYDLKKLEYQSSPQYQRQFNDSLQTLANALDRAYLTEKLNYCLEMINAEKVLDIQYDLRLGENLILWAQEHHLDQNPVIAIYLSAVQMMQAPEETGNFFKFKILLQQNEQIFSPKELKRLYTYLLNYCTRRINYHMDKKYYEYFLEINEQLLQKGFLLKDGYLPPWRFSNIVTAGLHTKRLDWVQSFIRENKKRLPPDYQDILYDYNFAHLLYYQKDYDQAQGLLSQMELQDPLLAVATKNLLVKIYYETGQGELLLSFLEAYRIYVYRNQLLKPTLKKQLQKFIDHTRKLYKTPEWDKEKLALLLDKLPSATETVERAWLEETTRKKVSRS